jgi:hypothetical protein
MRIGTYLAISRCGSCNEHVPHAILVIQKRVFRLRHVRFYDLQRKREEGGPDDEVAEEHPDGLISEDATNGIDDLLSCHRVDLLDSTRTRLHVLAVNQKFRQENPYALHDSDEQDNVVDFDGDCQIPKGRTIIR